MTLRERLERHYSADSISGCWLWTGEVDDKGYGVLDLRQSGGKRMRARRRAAREGSQAAREARTRHRS